MAIGFRGFVAEREGMMFRIAPIHFTIVLVLGITFLNPPLVCAQAGEVDLIFLTYAPADMDEDGLFEIMQNLKKVRKDQFGYNNILVRRIPKARFDLLAKLSRGQAPEFSPIKDGVLTSDDESGRVWRLVGAGISGSKREPQSIDLKYRCPDGKEASGRIRFATKEENFPIGKNGSGNLFSYKKEEPIISLPSGWRPIKYRMNWSDGNTSDYRIWPEGDKQFVIRLTRFSGGSSGRDAMLEALQEKEVGEAVVVREGGKAVMMAYAGVDVQGDAVSVSWQENNMLIGFPRLEGWEWDSENQEGLARVWALLPLTLEEKNKVVSDLNQISKGQRIRTGEESLGRRARIAAYLRGEEVAIRNIDQETKTYTSNFLLKHQSARAANSGVQKMKKLPSNWVAPDVLLDGSLRPTWYECIPAEGISGKPYLRAFQIGNTEEWKEERKQGAWVVFLYEHQLKGSAEDANNDSIPDNVTGPVKQPGDERNVYWGVREIQAWPRKVGKVKQK